MVECPLCRGTGKDRLRDSDHCPLCVVEPAPGVIPEAMAVEYHLLELENSFKYTTRGLAQKIRRLRKRHGYSLNSATHALVRGI